MALIINHGSWSPEQLDALRKEFEGVGERKLLHSIERVIGLLDMTRMGQPLDSDELRASLRELRAIRVELLKEVG